MDQLSDITRHLLRFSPDALIVVEAGGRIRFANQTVTELFGYAPEQLLDKPLETLIPERLRVGLGLAIVKEVSRLLGFTVSVGSRVDEGTRVMVNVPNQYLTMVLAGTESVSSIEPADGITRRSRVLLVEDNDGVRIATELFLRFEGFHVESALSPQPRPRRCSQSVSSAT